MTSMRNSYWRSSYQKRKETYAGEEKIKYSGRSFASKFEASVFQQLELREKAGELKDVQCQVHVLICGPEGHECDHKKKIESIVDFAFTDIKTGERVYCEAKGFETVHYKLKLRLWRHYRTEKLEIYKGTWLRPMLIEVVNG